MLILITCICQVFLAGRTHEQFSLFKSRHEQLLNKAPCQGKTCQFMLYTRANKTCQGETCQGKLARVYGT